MENMQNEAEFIEGLIDDLELLSTEYYDEDTIQAIDELKERYKDLIDNQDNYEN